MSTSRQRSRTKAGGIVLVLAAVVIGFGSAGGGSLTDNETGKPFSSSSTDPDDIYRDIWEDMETPDLRITEVVPFDELEDQNAEHNHITFARIGTGKTIYTYEGGVLPELSKLAEHDVVVVESEEQYKQLEDADMVVDSMNVGFTPAIFATRTQTADGLVDMGIATKNGDNYEIELDKLYRAVDSGLTLGELHKDDSETNPLLIKMLSPEESDATRAMALALAIAGNGAENLSTPESVEANVDNLSNVLTFPNYTTSYEFIMEMTDSAYHDKNTDGLYVSTEHDLIKNRFAMEDDSDVAVMYPSETVAVSRYIVALSDDGKDYLSRARGDRGVVDYDLNSISYRPAEGSVPRDSDELPVSLPSRVPAPELTDRTAEPAFIEALFAIRRPSVDLQGQDLIEHERPRHAK